MNDVKTESAVEVKDYIDMAEDLCRYVDRIAFSFGKVLDSIPAHEREGEFNISPTNAAAGICYDYLQLAVKESQDLLKAVYKI